MIVMSKTITTAITHMPALVTPSLSHACRCRDGRTPLHLSAQEGHTEVARLLVHAKSDVAARTRCGECCRPTLLSCQPTRFAADLSTLPSKWPSTKTNPTWQPSCAASARLHERFALCSSKTMPWTSSPLSELSFIGIRL